MRRPSHYLILFTALFLVVGWGLSWGNLGISGENPVSGRSGSRPWNPELTPTEVVGSVLDRIGWPVVGARLALRDGSEVLTDAEGRFRVPVMGPAAVELEISAPGHDVRIERVHPAVEEPLTLVLTDRLPWTEGQSAAERTREATMLAGEGFVEDEAGEPVRGAVVTVRETGASVRTDVVGQYTIPLPYETASLLAYDASGLVAISEPYTPPRRQGLTPVPPMVMVRGATVRGVLRNPDGDPMPGIAIVLEADGIQRRAEAGENGLFAVSGLLRGEYELTVLPFRGLLGFRVPVRVVGDNVDLQDLALLPVRPLRVQVVGRGGEPQANAHVVAEESGLRKAHAQADEFGWVTLVGLAGEELEFEVRSAVDFRPLPVVRRDGEQLIVVAD